METLIEKRRQRRSHNRSPAASRRRLVNHKIYIQYMRHDAERTETYAATPMILNRLQPRLYHHWRITSR